VLPAVAVEEGTPTPESLLAAVLEVPHEATVSPIEEGRSANTASFKGMRIGIRTFADKTLSHPHCGDDARQEFGQVRKDITVRPPTGRPRWGIATRLHRV